MTDKPYKSRRIDFTTNRGAKEIPDALRKSREKTQFGSGVHRQCVAISKHTKQRCKNPCVTGTDRCRMHRGKLIALNKGIDTRTPARKRADRARLDDWQTNVLDPVRNAPPELKATPAWKLCEIHGAGPTDLARLAKAWNNPATWMQESKKWLELGIPKT